MTDILSSSMSKLAADPDTDDIWQLTEEEEKPKEKWFEKPAPEKSLEEKLFEKVYDEDLHGRRPPTDEDPDIVLTDDDREIADRELSTDLDTQDLDQLGEGYQRIAPGVFVDNYALEKIYGLINLGFDIDSAQKLMGLMKFSQEPADLIDGIKHLSKDAYSAMIAQAQSYGNAPVEDETITADMSKFAADELTKEVSLLKDIEDLGLGLRIYDANNVKPIMSMITHGPNASIAAGILVLDDKEIVELTRLHKELQRIEHQEMYPDTGKDDLNKYDREFEQQQGPNQVLKNMGTGTSVDTGSGKENKWGVDSMPAANLENINLGSSRQVHKLRTNMVNNYEEYIQLVTQANPSENGDKFTTTALDTSDLKLTTNPDGKKEYDRDQLLLVGYDLPIPGNVCMVLNPGSSQAIRKETDPDKKMQLLVEEMQFASTAPVIIKGGEFVKIFDGEHTDKEAIVVGATTNNDIAVFILPEGDFAILNVIENEVRKSSGQPSKRKNV